MSLSSILNYISYNFFNYKKVFSKNYILYIMLSFILYTPHHQAYQLDLDLNNINKNTFDINLNFKLNNNLDEPEALIKDSLLVESNNPNITLTKPITRTNVSHLDNQSKTAVYRDLDGDGVQFLLTASTNQQQSIKTNNASENTQSDIIDVIFKTTNTKDIVQKQFNIKFDKSNKPYVDALRLNGLNKGNGLNNLNSQDDYADNDQSKSNKNLISKIKDNINSVNTGVTNIVKSFYSKLETLFSATGSSIIRFVVSFLLGVLLSLTPCIYPMIPVTVGIIQAAGSTSFIRNFFISLCYTLGVAITFASFGFITALGGAAFGNFQTSPYFIIPLVTLLAYLGFATFGLYEMYIPRFLSSPNTTNIKKGAPLSAFIFGALSGTVASPCLSPGLSLILSFVIKISKGATFIIYAESFLLLFVFGVGSSLPLLIIGTFSKSIDMLPKAGLWMVEVKKLLGLMLLGMCFYYLSNIIPWYILIWVLMAGIFILSLSYFLDIKSYDSKFMKVYKNIMGIIFMILFVYTGVQGYKVVNNHLYKEENVEPSFWIKDYDQALKEAKEKNKDLFIDFGTQSCPACKAIDKQISSNKEIKETLISEYVPIKVDATHNDNQPYATLKKEINKIIGFPTLIIFNPKTNKEVKRWQSSIGDIDKFIQDIKEMAKKK